MTDQKPATQTPKIKNLVEALSKSNSLVQPLLKPRIFRTSEQIATDKAFLSETTFVFSNNINTTLAGNVMSGDTTIVLSSSAGLPTLSSGQVMPITLNDAATGLNYEICYVTAITGATLTVMRGQENTGAQDWLASDFAFGAPTGGSVAPVNGNPSNSFQVADAVNPNDAVALDQFTQTLSGSNAGFSLPGGLIIQGGRFTTTNGSYTNLIFPIPFPNALIAISGNYVSSGNALFGVNFNLPAATNTYVPTAATAVGGGLSSIPITWIAIGY